MEEKVLKAIETFSLLSGVKDVTVALSGGADSMSLLSVLLSLKDKLSINVYAAHFNHMIRGKEADRDEEFVKKFCRDNNVELFCGRADVLKVAKDTGESTELAARKLRYEFLDKVGIGVIATAHTASDNLETAVFNLTRGTGLKGLCGIPPKRANFIRPLILCTRDDVENYCNKNKIPFVTDSSNLSDDYNRNFIRHNVIPNLKNINSAAENNFSNTAVSLSEDSDCLYLLAFKLYGECVSGDTLLSEKLKTAHPAVVKRVLKLFCEEKGKFSPDFLHINQLFELLSIKGRRSMSRDIFAVSDLKTLRFESKDAPPNTEFDVTLCDFCEDIFKKNEKVNNLLLKNLIDCDKIVGDLEIRTRKTGDSIRLKNRNCTKTLKKLYTEYGVDLKLRDIWPVISDGEGVIWIYKIGVSERAAVTKNSNKILKINTKINKLGE